MGLLDSTILAGAAAGVAASTVQGAIGKAEELLFLPEHEDVDWAPRLVGRLAEFAGVEVSEPTKWALGMGFHFGYGAFWGAAYSQVHRRYPVHPVVGGLAVGGFIYAITFPRWGGAVQTRTERPPRRRTRRKELVLASVTSSFGLTMALVYEALRPREEARAPDDEPANGIL